MAPNMDGHCLKDNPKLEDPRSGLNSKHVGGCCRTKNQGKIKKNLAPETSESQMQPTQFYNYKYSCQVATFVLYDFFASWMLIQTAWDFGYQNFLLEYLNEKSDIYRFQCMYNAMVLTEHL